ncbi:hypothetical protein HmCmsJML066_01417 [Escherichia coli]|nr:hypothetical protein HmCmsJML066_01417 [Escherichia coli]
MTYLPTGETFHIPAAEQRVIIDRQGLLSVPLPAPEKRPLWLLMPGTGLHGVCFILH